MSNFKDISGQQFGRLTALYRLHNYHDKHTKWLCVCDCGNLKEVRYEHLKNEMIVSCGCYHKEIVKNVNTKHGKHNTPLYNIWLCMKGRCYYVDDKRYKNYGGRGIAVCSEWKDDFQAFYNWATSNGYKEGLTIDRIDNDGNYTPDNCRWATRKQQARNTRRTLNITINGETHCLKDWCKILGLNYDTVKYRIHHNWSIERAFELCK